MIRILALTVFLFGFAGWAQARPVTVFAAASLRDALSEIARSFPQEVTLSFAGSGTLARQIAAGAPVDAVVLAHADWADWLAERDVLLAGSRVDVAGGALVLVGRKGSPDLPVVDGPGLMALLGPRGRLAIGQRDAVPAGSYARAWLQHAGLWETLVPRLAETDNVRAALALVAQGAAPLGVVYAADAAAEPRVDVLYRVPASAHPPIRYPAAALTEEGRDFVAFLRSPEAEAIFAQFGFAAPADGP
ncbi:molybdate ABC transporter substrate-binding protein [Sulfitobacter sp. HNIBRBA3233]|uniref:molybdate ABC transporter substrate-binding protein n=1 Tax=Sulfitobacter marinivivus TaxID=3158558 RepID=UPI0032DFD4F9